MPSRYPDEGLACFRSRHGLFVKRNYKEAEVRSISIVDDQGAAYQIWLESLAEGWRVTASDNRQNSHSVDAGSGQVSDALEQCYEAILRWIRSTGHTRTPC